MSSRDENAVYIGLDTGFAGDEDFVLRVSPHAVEELQELLEAEGVYSGAIAEMSAGPDLAVIAASFAGGLGGVAAVLTAFFHRNRHKSIKFSQGDTSFELNGLGEDEIKSLVTEALEDLHQKQLERDKEWRRVLGQDEESDSS